MSELHLYPMFVFSSFGYPGSLSMDALLTPAFSNNSSACLQSPFMLQATAMGKSARLSFFTASNTRNAPSASFPYFNRALA